MGDSTGSNVSPASTVINQIKLDKRENLFALDLGMLQRIFSGAYDPLTKSMFGPIRSNYLEI